MALKVDVITPERIVYSSAEAKDGVHVQEVVLPGAAGEIGILAGHVPLMTTLSSGQVQIHHSNGEVVRMAIHAGFAQILPNAINILTDVAELASEINADRARASLEAAEKRLQEEMNRVHVEEDPTDMHRAALERARARLFVAEEKEKK